jgi:hypothetical protein
MPEQVQHGAGVFQSVRLWKRMVDAQQRPHPFILLFSPPSAFEIVPTKLAPMGRAALHYYALQLGVQSGAPPGKR